MTTSSLLEAVELEHGVFFSLRYQMDEILGMADNGYHPELLTWTITLEASKYNAETDEETASTVGKIVAHSVDANWGDYGETLAIFDSHSEWISNLAEETVDSWDVVSRIIAVDTVQLDEEYRGMGIAPVILAKALHRIGGGAFAAILKASPMEQTEMSTKEIKAGEKALGALWECVGFKKVKSAYYYLDGDELSVEETERKVTALVVKKIKI